MNYYNVLVAIRVYAKSHDDAAAQADYLLADRDIDGSVESTELAVL